MKEYVAETGGRYTYSDDILNLQELTLSLSAIFDGCSDFIISGCEIEGPRVSPGYVWLGAGVPVISVPEPRLSRIRSIRLLTNCRRPSR